MEIKVFYPQLDYELILEKILEMSEEMKLWRKIKDHFAEPQAEPQTLKDQSIGQEEAYMQQYTQSEMEEEVTDQLNSGLDYELILEKILEMTEEMKSWRKTKDHLLESQAESQILKDQSTGQEEAYMQQCTQFEMEEPTDQLNFRKILDPKPQTETLNNYSINQLTTTEEDISQAYVQMENFEDQKMTISEILPLPKLIDSQMRSIESYDNLDNQAEIIIWNKMDYILYMILEEGEENFDQIDLLINISTQILRFDDIDATLQKPAWYRKKARVRFKNVI